MCSCVQRLPSQSGREGRGLAGARGSGRNPAAETARANQGSPGPDRVSGVESIDWMEGDLLGPFPTNPGRGRAAQRGECPQVSQDVGTYSKFGWFRIYSR